MSFLRSDIYYRRLKKNLIYLFILNNFMNSLRVLNIKKYFFENTNLLNKIIYPSLINFQREAVNSRITYLIEFV